jgi:hypothetical protein
VWGPNTARRTGAQLGAATGGDVRLGAGPRLVHGREHLLGEQERVRLAEAVGPRPAAGGAGAEEPRDPPIGTGAEDFTRSEPELANGPQPLKTGVLGPRDALPGQLRPLNQARTGKAA